MPLYTELTSCQAYLQQYENAPRPTSSVTVYGRDYQSVDIGTGETSVRTVGEEYGTENRDNVLLFAASEGSLTYEIEIPQTGCYCLYFSYLPIPSATSSVSFSVAIDGKVPYDTASRATLNKVFVNDGEQRFDDYGNQIRPAQHQTALWCESALSDTDGMWNEPLCFYLEAGTHEIGFQIEKGWFALDSFTFRNPEPLPDYAACRRASDETAEDTLLRLEGENAACKSDAALFPTADNSSYLVSPASPSRTVYNTIGAGNWRKAGQTISWTIPAAQITRNGWYRVAFKARQNEIRGFCSNRRLYLDGKVPCKELDCIRFPYSNKWQTVIPTDADGNSVELYLTAGEDHTLTLEVIPGDIGASLRRLDTAVRELRTDYRRILMLTSPNPDKYTDYYVHERIPGLLPDFTRLSEELRQIRTEIESLSGSKGSEAAAIERMSVILDACIERPLRIPDYLGQIRDNLTALSAWMYESREQPLEIDYIEIASPDCQFSSSKENPFRQAGFGVQRFFSSFFHDYTALSDDAGEDTIEVWVALGREQALAVKTLTDSLYNPTHETKISVNLVVGGIVEASLAGKGPDAALFLGGEFPVNLAARGLLTDLTQFPDYDKTAAQFAEQAAVPYTYQEGVYGLPLTQSWAMLFYRKDILAELGFDRPPETWDELIAMLPALQRNYMEAGLVLPVVSGTNAAISPATETGHTFAALMLQNGAGYYDAEQTRTTFDSIPAVQAFEKWTDFYTKYSFEQTYDAFSRFRTGEYPLVIADYGFCNQLAAAAPELRGLWDFTSIPGTVQPDGSISHAVNSTSSGAVIFDKCKDKQAAWEYLQWFTSEEVQAEFGLQTESLLGQMGRYAAANTAARQKLPWSAAEQRKLTAAQEELREIPVTPASYAVTRGIMNAFRETVNNHENPRDTLLWYNREINAEITRKRENLGVETQP
ncbi:MAG: extracellular solute-binding protein [Oscillospiraceae bacterium]|nr:extracellular solute-binding protein [Oscillospiraceae bacterium]